jgi:hypothetical protein
VTKQEYKRVKIQKLIGFPRELLDEIEEYAKARRAEEPGATFSMNDAVRVLCSKALAAMKAKGGG